MLTKTKENGNDNCATWLGKTHTSKKLLLQLKKGKKDITYRYIKSKNDGPIGKKDHWTKRKVIHRQENHLNETKRGIPAKAGRQNQRI